MEPYDDELQRIVAELNRAAPSAPPHFTEAARPAVKVASAPSSNLEQLLAFAAQRNASDVLLIAGAPIASLNSVPPMTTSWPRAWQPSKSERMF